VETLTRMRALPGGNDVRVVVISAAAERERWRFAALGVQDVLANPVSLPELLAKIELIAQDAGWQRGVVEHRVSARPRRAG
jgi:CheY-like chemotaxis protein